MSKFKLLTKVAFAVSTAITLTACDSGGDVSGGGGVQVASDACSVATVAITATSYSNSVASLVDSDSAGQYQYSVVTQPTDGTIVMNASTGDYTYTPFGNTSDARGFKTSFTYGVLENGSQVDSAEVEIIYGTKRIMPLGDSITFGVTFFDGASDNPANEFAVGYRKALYDRLIADGYAVDFVGSRSSGTDLSVDLDDVNHEGHPGIRANFANVSGSPGGLANNVSAYLTAAKPDLVLSHAGTNDLYQGNTATETTTNVRTLVSNMQTWQSGQSQALNVLVAKIIPSYELGGNFSTLRNSTINFFNSSMESDINATFSGGEDFKVTVVDHNTPLDAATDMTQKGTGGGQDRTGLHPNTAGYAKIANTWYDAIVSSGELEKCDD